MNRYEWIVFDFDGTLVDSIHVMYGVYCTFMKMHNLSCSEDEFEKLNGPKIDEIIEYLKLKHNLAETTDVLLKQYEDIVKSSYLKSVKPFEGRKTLLESLKKKGYKLALVTSAAKELVEEYLKHYDLEYFNILIYGNNIKNSKPHPEIYRVFASKIANSDKTLVFEDSENGIKSAKEAGLKVVNAYKKDSKEMLEIIEKK